MEDIEDQISNRWIPLIMLLASVGSILLASFNDFNILAFLPLIVVSISIGSQILRDNYKEKKERKHKKEFLKEMIIAFNKGIENQIKYINSFIQKLEEEKIQNSALTTVSRVNKNNINVISRLDAYKFLIKKDDVKNSASQFEDLYSHIDLADSVAQDLDPLCEKYNSELNNYSEQFYVHVDLIRKYYDGIYQKIKVASITEQEVMSDPLLKEFVIIYQTWAQEEPKDRDGMFIIAEKLIYPLQKLQKEHFNYELSNYILECLVDFERYKNTKAILTTRLQHNRDSFAMCHKVIDEYLPKLFKIK
jgi:hypothetical protein